MLFKESYMSLENMEVFEDTIKLCETNGKIRESIAQSVKNQKLIPEWSDLPDVEKRRFPEHANIIVSPERESISKVLAMEGFAWILREILTMYATGTKSVRIYDKHNDSQCLSIDKFCISGGKRSQSLETAFRGRCAY